MQLKESVWQNFEAYLTIERKMSSHVTSIYPLHCRFKKLIRWFGEREFNRDNVNLFIGEMHKSGAKPSYTNKMIVLCKHLDKYLKLNNLTDYTYFKETYQMKEILSPQEIQALAGTTLPYKRDAEYMNLRQKCLIWLLGTTGSRIGEALSLKWRDIGSEPPHVIYRETKNGEVRVVPIGKSVFDLIQTLPRRSEFVFSSYRGGVLGQPQLNLDFKRRAHAIGIKKPVYNHIFRHSYITTMLEAGVDVSDVARIVGHKNLNSTMRYKNSLLGYYAGVVQLHPLIRSSLSLSQISLNLKKDLEKLVDTSQFTILHEETSKNLSIQICRRFT